MQQISDGGTVTDFNLNVDSVDFLLKQAVNIDEREQARKAYDALTIALRSLAKTHSKLHSFKEYDKSLLDFLMSLMNKIADVINGLVAVFGFDHVLQKMIKPYKVMEATDIAKYLNVTNKHLYDWYLWKNFPLFVFNGRFFAVTCVVDAWVQKVKNEHKTKKSI